MLLDVNRSALVAGLSVNDVAVGGGILVLGSLEAATAGLTGYPWLLPWLVTVGIAVAAALVRVAGWASYGILWAGLLVQFAGRADLMVTDAAVALVGYGIARWGAPRLVTVSGALLPVALGGIVLTMFSLAETVWQTRVARNIVVRITDLTEGSGISSWQGTSWRWVVVVTTILLLVVPWLLGLTVRFLREARTSQLRQESAEHDAQVLAVENAQMAHLARLKEDQARLAHDVHDVVGHSLAVILAQAQAALVTADADDAAHRHLQAIVTTARSSLREVRAVLADAESPNSDLDALLGEAGAAGVPIEVTDAGRPRPLPPDLAAVAFRVLQEMITNAIRHGAPGRPVAVSRTWRDDDLALAVRNVCRPVGPDTDPGGGRGIPGMRARLDRVGGSLVVVGPVLAGPGAGEATHTIMATVPLRSRPDTRLDPATRSRGEQEAQR